MRHGRAKAARKTLKFFFLTGNIKPPYKVLLDGNFIVTSIRQKVPLRDRMDRLLQGEKFTFFVTRASLIELDALIKASVNHEDRAELFRRAKQFGLDECEIIEEFEEGVDVGNVIKEIVSFETNSKGYFCATQDEDLSNKLREMPNVPILRLSRSILLLEAPSAASRRNATSEERGKLFNMNDEETVMISKIKSSEKRKRKQEIEMHRIQGGRIKAKAKGPNPLSCKKSKHNDSKENENKTKRRRRRKSNVNASST